MNAFSTLPLERARALEPLVRRFAEQGDIECRLPAPVAQALAENGLYRIGAPVAYGGEEADPVTQIETIETISGFDGAAGWNLMIGIENFGLLAPGCDNCRHLLDDPMIVLCSSTAARGKAEKDGDGYRVNGTWQFVSGCQNSQVFGATVRVYENGEQVGGLCYALVPEPDFEIEETWNVAGMRGSGSHDVHIKDAWIPANQIVVPIGSAARDSALMRFPLGARLSYNKVAIGFGLGRAALDAFVELAVGKVPRFSSKTLRQRATAQQAIAEAEVRLRGSRALVMELVREMWDKVHTGSRIDDKERAIFHIACSDAVRAAAESVDRVCEAAGTSANFRGHPLERIARDVKVVRQHVTVASHHIEDGGRVLLGLEPTGLMLRAE